MWFINEQLAAAHSHCCPETSPLFYTYSNGPGCEQSWWGDGVWLRQSSASRLGKKDDEKNHSVEINFKAEESCVHAVPLPEDSPMEKWRSGSRHTKVYQGKRYVH